MTFLTIIFIISLGVLSALFVLAAFEVRAGRRFGGTRRNTMDGALGELFNTCRRALAADSRSRARAGIARCANAAIEQFSRVRAPGAFIAERATSVMFSSRRALVATSTASPFLRKMAGYKERVESGKEGVEGRRMARER